jgi:hypothetical protein
MCIDWLVFYVYPVPLMMIGGKQGSFGPRGEAVDYAKEANSQWDKARDGCMYMLCTYAHYHYHTLTRCDSHEVAMLPL